jgi:hypothetical protein
MRRTTASASLAAFALIAGVFGIAGCGLGAGPSPGAVQLTVTSNFGESELALPGPLKVSGQETVMSLLMRNYTVSTRFGGGFVQSINGISGGKEGGNPVDWFYFVNGVQATKGAASTNVHAGDRIWWDHHDWSQAQDVPAVVGSFPQPFLTGPDGKRLPVRLECSDVGGSPCQAVNSRLQSLGIPVAIAGAGPSEEPLTLRVIVGPWSKVRVNIPAELIEQGPRASGVYARFTGGGSALELLDQQGHATSTLRAGSGMIAATRNGEDDPVWFVTGTDEAGVQLAAASFNQSSLSNHLAVALTAGHVQPLPVAVGG